MISTPGAIVLILILLGPAVLAENVSPQPAATWSQWRGPNRDGRAEMFGALSKWPEKPAEVWQTEVGLGHASPVTDGERVFLFSRIGGDEVAAAFSLADGAELWSQRYPVSFRPRMGGGHHGAGPKSTPAVAGGRLVTLGITAVLSSWDAETGERQWRIDFADQHDEEPFPRWGTSLSPLVADGRVIVHFGSDGGALVALDAATGEEVWRRAGSAPSYASPVLGEIGGREQLVTLTADGLLALGFDGRELWSWEFPMSYMRQNVATPIVSGGVVVIGGEKRPLIALRPRPQQDDWHVRVVWSRDDLPLDMSTAVADGDRICGLTHLKKGQAFCVGPGGDEVWRSAPRFADHASIVTVPGALFYLLPDATLVVLDTSGSAYRELARYTLADSETWAHPAVIEAGLVVKSRDRLTRWSLRPK